MSAILLALGVALLLILAFSNLPYSATIRHPMIWRDMLAAAGFMAIILSLAARPWAVLVNSTTKLLGKVSFSSYLLQFAVLEVVLMLLGPVGISGVRAVVLFVIAVVSLISVNTLFAVMTYRFIEEPWMKRGHRIATRIGAPAVGAPMVKVI
jgi:peptidoglycan/LPS O-acetylase OafA/YrhL